jgi:5-methylcytosine-specific restriction protein A
MIANKINLILAELKDGTGAAVAAKVSHIGLRSGLRIWFDDLDERHGPVAELRPFGLKGHRVDITFGNFSGDVIAQIKIAPPEDMLLARALVSSITDDVELNLYGQALDTWEVKDGGFKITAKIRNFEDSQNDASIVATCRSVIVPIMAALAELIGYDEISQKPEKEEPAFEGAVLKSVITKRERNPRNRLLCIRIHGEQCGICSLVPHEKYGEAGSIIEVHHLEPLASLESPKPYDPATDLIPLCPSCHRAVHTRRPVPLTPEELRCIIGPENAI